MMLPVLIIGAGGHGRVVADALRAAGRTPMGFLDTEKAMHGREIDGATVLGGDDLLDRHPPGTVALANGIGSTARLSNRRRIYEQLVAAGYLFETIQHPSAVVSPSAALGAGVQVMAGAVVQPGATVGENTIINTGAIVDHDCAIGGHCHLAPGSVLSGGIVVGDGCHIGTGAAIVQGIRIGGGALIAAGAVVVSDVEENQRIAGVPGRPMVSR